MDFYGYLEEKAKNLRKKVIKMAYDKKKGHIGGALSIVEIIISLYESRMKKDDKFILSKGHGCLPYFITLIDKGYNPQIAGHPERDPANGIECTTGSLGHGFPIGVGMALGRKMLKRNGKIYVLMSDAECQEGTTWESLLIAGQHKLDNLTIIIDNNNLQTLGKTSEIISVKNIGRVFENFGWDVIEINGHSFQHILNALDKPSLGKPKLIVANTIKGKGVSFMENVSMWHTKIPDDEQFKKAMEELA